MQALQLELDDIISTREEIFDNKSAKWQDSEKSESYNELTERLQEMLDELIDWQTELGE